MISCNLSSIAIYVFFSLSLFYFIFFLLSSCYVSLSYSLATPTLTLCGFLTLFSPPPPPLCFSSHLSQFSFHLPLSTEHLNSSLFTLAFLPPFTSSPHYHLHPYHGFPVSLTRTCLLLPFPPPPLPSHSILPPTEPSEWGVGVIWLERGRAGSKRLGEGGGGGSGGGGR